MPDRPPLPHDLLETLNRMRGGFNETLGLRFVTATHDEVVAELEVKPELLQPYGLVHGGVHSAMIETLASTAAAINAYPHPTVGLENSTSFLKAVRSGRLRGRATPLSRGRRSQVWQVEIRDEQEQLVATGRVRMLCLPPDAAIAGATVDTSLGS